MTVTGGCRCGASRYTRALDAPPAAKFFALLTR
jgi:hypothetical protein